MNFVNLHVHSHFSLLDGLSKPDQIATRCAQLGQTACAITDHGSISGAAAFMQSCKKVCKHCGRPKHENDYCTYEPANIKPIIGCLTAGQTIFTINGPKNIEDCICGDLVLTHTGQFQPIITTMKRPYNGKLYKIYLSNNKNPICITGEHPILIYNGNKTSWIKAQDLCGGRHGTKRGIRQWKQYACLPKLASFNNNTIDIINYISKYNMCIKNGYIVQQTKNNKYHTPTEWKNIYNTQIITENFAYFLGLFCAKGSFGKRDGILSGQINFTLNINEIKYANKIKTFVKQQWGIDVIIKPRTDKNTLDVSFSCLPIALFLYEVCGDGCYNKTIPNFVFNMPIQIRQSFVVGLLDGDGKKGRQKTLRITSKNLAWGFRQLAVDLNEWLSVKEYHHQNRLCFTVSYNATKSYKRNLFDTNYVYKPISHIEIVDIDTVVYNLEIQKDNSYVGELTYHNCEFYVTEEQSTLKDKDNLVTHQLILAKNIEGWKKLIQLVSKSNDKDRFYYKPRIDLEMMIDICDDNLISFSGHLGSTLHLRSSDMSSSENYVQLMKKIFGEENFFIEIQLIDGEHSQEAKNLAKRMRELAEYTHTKCVATGDAHYPSPQDAIDHQVLLCSSMKTTLKKVQNNPNFGLQCFFRSNQFHIPNVDEMIQFGNTPEEIKNSEAIADMCDDYDITGPPKLPKFPCPDGLDENAYLRKLCIQGWKRLNNGWDSDAYGSRVRKELAVIEEANLAGYFLIVQDYVNWGKNQGWLIGPGRGSGAGSLVSYLLGITCIDPIPYGLIFERFYNAGRNTKDRVSLPDIDVDFPIKKRKDVIEYLKNKYSHDRVCQMATFGRLMGRGALKEVLRVNGVCDYEEMNLISKNIPQEAEISDQLEAADETSIIRWTLHHDPKLIADWCKLEEDGTLTGQYASIFEQAIRLEGTYKSQGKHAAGIVLSAEPLDQVCPMINDKNSSEKIAGMSMNDLESMGHVKFDILGVALLDKLMGVNNLLQYGKVNP